MTENIIKNAAKCTACGKVIVSTHRHDFNCHKCEAGNDFCVDGGNAYIRRVFRNASDFVDASEYAES